MIYQALSQDIYYFLRRVLMFYYLKMERLDNIIQPYLKIFFLIKSDTFFRLLLIKVTHDIRFEIMTGFLFFYRH